MSTLIRYHSELDEALEINDVNSTMSTRLYTDLINTQRAIALTNQYNQKTRKISPQIIQDLGCLETEVVDATSCCDVSIPVNCKIVRSIRKVPKVIEFYNSLAITRVGPIKITSKPFSFVEVERIPYTGTGRANSNQIYAFLYNDYMYLYSKDEKVYLIKKFNVRGVFEDPTEVGNFVTCDNKPCWTPESEYPMAEKTWGYIKENVVQQLLRKLGIPIDESNDTKDDKASMEK